MNKPNLSVDLNGLVLKNPVTVASGTFGFGREFSEWFDLSALGAISVKGLTLEPRQGNDAPRVAETPMGMLNSVGLQNPGVESFIREDLPWLRQFDTKIIANINGNTIEEYCAIARRISETDVDSLELNISCPNVKAGGMAFGTDPAMVYEVVHAVRKSTQKHLMVKLSPNVRDIRETARAAEAGGADCLSMINTLTGMVIDTETRKPILSRGIGGMSGPAVRPIAVRMVYETYGAVKIPILGMGGIATARDGIEMMLAGATAIALGTILFSNPVAPLEVVSGIQAYLERHGLTSATELIRNLK